jgi:leader peptidase (prepilin peptidase)/N-methyltransferase
MNAVTVIDHQHRNATAVWGATLVAVLCAVRWPAMSVVEFGLLLGAAAAIDLVEHRLPNVLLAMAVLVALGNVHDPASAGRAGIGALVAGMPMLFVRLARGVGMGDVKAAVVIGVQLGASSWTTPALAIACAALLASVAGVVARRQRLALGPWLWVGWCAAQAATEMGWK